MPAAMPGKTSCSNSSRVANLEPGLAAMQDCPARRRQEPAASRARAEAGRGAGTSGSPTLARRPPGRDVAGMRLNPARNDRGGHLTREGCRAKNSFHLLVLSDSTFLVRFCSSIGSLVWHSQALWPPAIQAALKGQFSSFQHLFLRCASCLTGLHSPYPTACSAVGKKRLRKQ